MTETLNIATPSDEEYFGDHGYFVHHPNGPGIPISNRRSQHRHLRGERKRARGERVEGVKPYGHFPAEQHLIEHTSTSAKPRKGKQLSVAALAAQVNAEGHRNRAGRE